MKHKSLMLLVLLGFGALLAITGTPACGPFPAPGPIPTPTPPPPTTTTTTTTLPPGPGPMALHAAGPRLLLANGTDPRLLGSIAGSLQDEPGWPLVSFLVLDDLQTAGLNWTHVRTGPFTAEGEAPQFAFYARDPISGKYDLTRLNPEFLSLLRSTVVHARAAGVYVEVDLIDRWVRQHGRELGLSIVHPMRSRPGSIVRVSASAIDPWSAANNLQGEEHGGLGIFQAPPDPVHVAFLRGIFSAVCDLDNVTFSTGNEAFKSDSIAWENAVTSLIRAECPGHVIGINSDSSTPGDFQILHQSFAPAAASRPTEVNEFGDDISPEAVISEAMKADSAGTYFEYWKGSHSPEQWLTTIKVLGQIRAGNPPAPVGCLPPPEDGKWTPICKTRADIPGVAPLCSSLGLTDQKSGVLATAESKASSDNPALFEGSCLKVLSETNLILGLQAVGTAARAAGECGGRKDDAVFLRRNDGTMTDSYWQEEHALAWATGCFTQVSNAFKYVWAHPAEEPPPPAACSLTNDQITEWRWDLKKEGGQLVDLTVYVCGAAARAELKQCGSSCCPLGDVEGNGACRQKLLGDPILEVQTPPGGATIIPQGDPPQFTVKVNTGDGFLKARGSKGPNAFKRWHIHATVPACDADAAGICAFEPL